MSEYPRRNDTLRNTPAEMAIREATRAVEAAGADPRLTDAVVLLQHARDAVADFVDGVPRGTGSPRPGYAQLIDGPRHVCGACGFGLAAGDTCPACVSERAR